MWRSFTEMTPDCRDLWFWIIHLERLRAARFVESSGSEDVLHYQLLKRSSTDWLATLEIISGCQIPQQTFSRHDNRSLKKPAFKNSWSAGWNIWRNRYRCSVGKLPGKEGVKKRDKILLIKSISQNESQRHYIPTFKWKSSDTQGSREVQSELQKWIQ